jgi:hypothetical protein
MIEQIWDRRLIERTVEIADQTNEFGSRPLRAALDSSPLWGAGRVEDTYNLWGHALRKARSVIARQQGRGLAEVAASPIPRIMPKLRDYLTDTLGVRPKTPFRLTSPTQIWRICATFCRRESTQTDFSAALLVLVCGAK